MKIKRKRSNMPPFFYDIFFLFGETILHSFFLIHSHFHSSLLYLTNMLTDCVYISIAKIISLSAHKSSIYVILSFYDCNEILLKMKCVWNVALFSSRKMRLFLSATIDKMNFNVERFRSKEIKKKLSEVRWDWKIFSILRKKNV